MRTFFLFAFLSYLLRNPLLALLLVGAIVYFTEARYRGRYFNPAKLLSRKSTIRELRHRVELNPHDADARNDLGRLLVEEGRPHEALEHLEVAVERMDESPETHYFLGLALLATGRSEEGRARIERALELKPAFLYGEPRIKLAEHLLETGDAQGAEAQAEQGVAINTSSVKGWVLLGRAHRERGDEAGGREAFAKAEEAFRHLPRYLRMPNRRWRRAARRQR